MRKAIVSFMTVCLIAGSGCGSSDSSGTEDTSVSGAVAGTVGGSISSGSTGTQASIQLRSSRERLLASLDFLPEARASGTCPTVKTAAGSGCTQSGSDDVDLSLGTSGSGCTPKGGVATWTGTLEVGVSTGATCGTAPSVSSGPTITRRFVTAAGGSSAGSGTRTAASGTVVTVDDATANLGNFDNGTIAATAVGGSAYGTSVTWSAGARTGVAFQEHLVAQNSSGTTVWNHSLSGGVSISETSGATSRTVTTPTAIVTYHNLLQVVGSTNFTGVTYADGCCFPTTGTITTTFSAGTSVAPTSAGSGYVGKSESLVFSSTCGQATYTSPSGSTSTVTLNHCL